MGEATEMALVVSQPSDRNGARCWPGPVGFNFCPLASGSGRHAQAHVAHLSARPQASALTPHGCILLASAREVVVVWLTFRLHVAAQQVQATAACKNSLTGCALSLYNFLSLDHERICCLDISHRRSAEPRSTSVTGCARCLPFICQSRVRLFG